MRTERDRTIALGAVFQAAALVSGIARSGRWDQKAIEASIHSLFQVDAETVDEVFGDAAGVEFGLRTLRGQFGGGKPDTELSRYVIQLLHLERQLAKRSQMMDRVGREIERARGRLSHFSMTHDNILGQFADLYSETISTLSPRIMVHGDQFHLRDSANIHRIRALLLAGIRAARLWRQCGGSRWRIVFQRQATVQACDSVLAEIGTDHSAAEEK